jgi:hypothetical protein
MLAARVEPKHELKAGALGTTDVRRMPRIVVTVGRDGLEVTTHLGEMGRREPSNSISPSTSTLRELNLE